MTYLIVIQTNSSIRVKAYETIRLEDIQKLVGGYIETTPSRFEGCVLVVNEEGKLNHMHVNKAATELLLWPESDVLCGDAVLMKRGDEDLEGFSEEEAAQLVEAIHQQQKTKVGA